MDKTALNEQAQKKNKISAKKASEIKVSGQIAAILKREWEELAKKQEQRGVKISAGRKISSITLTKNRRGKISVQVNMQNGARVLDNAREKNIVKFKEKAQKVYFRAKVEELLKKIKEYGYAAVESEIPAELKEAVLKGMEKANISTSYKGAKAEAEAARQASRRAAEFADKAAGDFLNSTATGAAGFAAANMVINAEGGYLHDASGNRIKSTPRLENLLNKGVQIFIPSIPKNIPEHIKSLAEEQSGTVLDIAAKSAENIKNIASFEQNYIGSMSVTITKEDGRKIKGEASALATKNTVQKEILNAIELAQNGKDDRERDRAIKLLNTQLSVLQHNNIIPKEATEFPLDKLDAVREFVMNNASQLKERGAVQYFSEEGKKEYYQNKTAEKETKKQLQNDYEKNKEIRKEVAKRPTLLSEGVRKKDLSDHTFSDIIKDMRVHRKGGYQASEEEKLLSYVLKIEREKAHLDKKDKISADISKKCMDTLYAFTEEKRKNPQLDSNRFLEEKGIKPPEPKAEKHISGDKAKTASNAAKEALPAPGNAVSAAKISEKAAVEQKPSATVSNVPNKQAQPVKADMTEKDRVSSKIKENMEKYKTSVGETKQTAEKQPAVKKDGLQQKLQKNQQGAKAPARPAAAPSAAVQAALLKKKEEMSR